jgi:hypothetical protein
MTGDLALTTMKALLGRLTWPSAMVRERACREIANLLVFAPCTNATRNALLDWIEHQALESVACLGIVVLLHARSLDRTMALPDASSVESRITSPSILSQVLLARYSNWQFDSTSPSSSMHSGTAPNDFEPLEFFHRYVKQFLPPIYHETATRIDINIDRGFTTQWAFEWKCLTEKLGVGLSTSIFHYWEYGRGPGIQASDCEMCEVYRSAYLRALAWAYDVAGLNRRGADVLALRTCPADIGLMAFAPLSKPAFWPERMHEKPKSVVDSPALIGAAVRQLWEQQRREHSQGLLLGHAVGTIKSGKTRYSLRISGAIQKCDGPESPDLAEVADWVMHRVINQISGTDLLDTSVVIPDADNQKRIGDWLIFPLANQLDLPTVPRMQYWRLYYGIWVPNPDLSDERIAITCSQEGLEFKTPSGAVGHWRDWVEELFERDVRDAPPYTGSTLFLQREFIEKAATELGGNYCWIVELRAFHRESRFEEVKEIPSHMAFGCQQIVTPDGYT